MSFQTPYALMVEGKHYSEKKLQKQENQSPLYYALDLGQFSIHHMEN